jgi:transcriptional regulator with XRE-family HTH domain
MAMSSISQHSREPAPRLSASLDPVLRRALGAELRRRRRERKLTQAALGTPLTRAYVSAVESGRIVPSLPALRLMAGRLGLSLSAFFLAVEESLFTDT